MSEQKNIVCIIQARVGSTRLPNKIFLDLAGETVLSRVITRLKNSKLINKIVVASPDSEENNVIEEFISNNFKDIGIFRGSESNVLDRYYQAAVKYSADVIIRITSDCPLIDPEETDKVIRAFLDNQVDYVANILGKRTYPRGLDTEVFSFAVLEKMWRQAKTESEREHVTLYLHNHPEEFSTRNVENDHDYSAYRLTLDVAEDYKLINLIYQELYKFNKNFKFKEIVELFGRRPELLDINKNVEQKKV